MTTQSEIREWLERGKQQGATHMLVVCDTYDWEDYPVYRTAADPDKVRIEAETYRQTHEMQKVMEVYRLDMDWDAQLRQHRAFNY